MKYLRHVVRKFEIEPTECFVESIAGATRRKACAHVVGHVPVPGLLKRLAERLRQLPAGVGINFADVQHVGLHVEGPLGQGARLESQVLRLLQNRKNQITIQ